MRRQRVPLVLTDEADAEIDEIEDREATAISKEWGQNRPGGPVFYPGSAEADLHRLRTAHGDIRQPKSVITVAQRAWLYDLRRHAKRLDPFAQDLLTDWDLLLANLVLGVSEDPREDIEWLEIRLTFPQEDTIYNIWPEQLTKTTAELKLSANAGIKIGVTPALAIVTASPEASANLLFTKTWRWATSFVKVLARANHVAQWRFERDRENPFGGDRDLLIVLQTPRSKMPRRVEIGVNAWINPHGLFSRAFPYHEEEPQFTTFLRSPNSRRHK